MLQWNFKPIIVHFIAHWILQTISVIPTLCSLWETRCHPYSSPSRSLQVYIFIYTISNTGDLCNCCTTLNNATFPATHWEARRLRDARPPWQELLLVSPVLEITSGSSWGGGGVTVGGRNLHKKTGEWDPWNLTNKFSCIRMSQNKRLIHKEVHADPPLRNDPIKKWLWMVRNVLNRTRMWIKKFSDFYFSSYHRKLGWFFHKNDT